MSFIHKKKEYARFGAGWVRRKDAEDVWKDCPLDDVPSEVQEAADEAAHGCAAWIAV